VYSKEEVGCDSAELECDLAAAGSKLEAAVKDWLVASALEVVAIVVAVEATIVPTTKVEVGVEVIQKVMVEVEGVSIPKA
jgi:hypothetical protein